MNTEGSERNPKGGSGTDRISNLPCNVIDRILAFLPVQDAARTGILSRKWRNVWAEYPHLVLGKHLYKEMVQNISPTQFQHDYVDLVNKILLQHNGPILTFGIYLPSLHSSRYFNIDQWMLFISRKGVRKLLLVNSNPVPYKLPSYVFSCPELTHLRISNCTFRAPDGFEGFSKLTSLFLTGISFGSSILNTPHLTRLSLRNCSDTRHFCVKAPLLQSLDLYENDSLDLSHYTICKGLLFLGMFSTGLEHQRQGYVGRTFLRKFLSCSDMLSHLCLNVHSLNCLVADNNTIPVRLPIIMSQLTHLTLSHLIYDLEDMARILCLLRSCPKLSELELWAHPDILDAYVRAVDYLGKPGMMEQKLDQLQNVKLKYFKGSTAELHFVKLLLAISPSLQKLYIEESQQLLDSIEWKNISRELIRFSRASPKAEIIFS